jgi:hypothetical protein
MKQDKIFDITKKATEIPLAFTHSVIEESKRLRHLSPKVAKIGTIAGSSIGVGLLLTGMVQLFFDKPLWAAGSLTAGVLTIASNLIHYHRVKKC